MIVDAPLSDVTSALLRNGDPSVFALIDTKPTVVRDTAFFPEAFSLLLDHGWAGVAVVIADGVLRWSPMGARPLTAALSPRLWR